MQLDIFGGIPLADGREAKIVTGIDGCSRFVVLSAAMRRYRVLFEVLTDIQAVHGPHLRPQPVEVLWSGSAGRTASCNGGPSPGSRP